MKIKHGLGIVVPFLLASCGGGGSGSNGGGGGTIQPDKTYSVDYNIDSSLSHTGYTLECNHFSRQIT
ncbi:MAG: hypothetical protein K2P99_07320 [Burkholderiales bacterium]|nr:hypothetical protein [Burkholderiales bacterium]